MVGRICIYNIICPCGKRSTWQSSTARCCLLPLHKAYSSFHWHCIKGRRMKALSQIIRHHWLAWHSWLAMLLWPSLQILSSLYAQCMGRFVFLFDCESLSSLRILFVMFFSSFSNQFWENLMPSYSKCSLHSLVFLSIMYLTGSKIFWNFLKSPNFQKFQKFFISFNSSKNLKA